MGDVIEFPQQKRLNELKTQRPKQGSPDWVEMMSLAKAAKVHAGDDNAKGGRRRKPTRTEAEAQALRELYPKALLVLEEQLEDDDPAIRQKAAMRVVDQVEGKAKQTVKNENEDVTVIRFETAAIPDGSPSLN